MTENDKDIIDLGSRWIASRLADRSTVVLPCIGKFAPFLTKEYFLREGDGSLSLYPPSVGLTFAADPFVLEEKRYSSFDVALPGKLFPKSMTEAVAGLYERDEKEVETVLNEYVSGILSNLFKGRRVTLFNLGDFFVSEVSGRLLMLNFEPSSVLLRALNHPFSSYMPVRLPSDTPIPDSTDILTTAPGDRLYQFPILDREESIIEEETALTSASPAKDTAIATDAAPVISTSSSYEQPAGQQPDFPRSRKQQRKWSAYLIYLAILAGILLCFLLFLFPKEVQMEEQVYSQKDTAVIAPPVQTTTETTPFALPKDTISTGETLAKLSRRHYGITEYWVYLYMWNKDSISDPNNVPLGTVLEIPDLKHYDLKANLKESIREAKDWAFLIQTAGFDGYDSQRPTLPSNRTQTPQ